ncbi:MAG: CsbD family protein [Vagococcus sp.]|uniref:CsbD family protein n=1 Tax=Vagococcus TaxID=2737 RepID=UPI002FC60167
MVDKGHTDKIKGKTKEVLGDLRGDNKQKAEGILDQAIGKTKEITSDIKEKTDDFIDDAKDKFSKK